METHTDRKRKASVTLAQALTLGARIGLADTLQLLGGRS